MDKYTYEILSVLKHKFTEVAGEKNFQSDRDRRQFYLEKLNDNLYRPMSAGAYAEYSQGSGSEIDSGKMQALRSSSVLTYNLFWDQIAEIASADEHLGAGIYQVEFEKQYHTLKKSVSRAPANLDAFLYNKHTKEAIACEMKMTEWIFNKPGMLRAAYLNPENYIDGEAGEIFVSVAKDLILYNAYDDPEKPKTEYPPNTARYDAFQMFKHAVACYSACVEEEPREIRKLTLVNCVWTLSDPALLSDGFRKQYEEEEAAELSDFAKFHRIMEPVIELFAKKGIAFDICFYRFSDFLQLLRKTEEELNYLRRYTLL